MWLGHGSYKCSSAGLLRDVSKLHMWNLFSSNSRVSAAKSLAKLGQASTGARVCTFCTFPCNCHKTLAWRAFNGGGGGGNRAPQNLGGEVWEQGSTDRTVTQLL